MIRFLKSKALTSLLKKAHVEGKLNIISRLDQSTRRSEEVRKPEGFEEPEPLKTGTRALNTRTRSLGTVQKHS